ncbi:hypothetical protein M8R20_13405 [Pseudomonas sp. R2.Fl]|nr:hypothetical protein [Pseudomonas sp. R2.Fl]
MIRITAFGTRLAALAALTVFTAGCTTTAKDLLGLEPAEDVAAASEPARPAGKKKAYVDPMVAQVGDNQAALAESEEGMDQAQPPIPGDPSQVGEVVMQPTGVSASQSSIFSVGGAVAADAAPTARETPASLVPSGVPQHGYNAAVASLFSAPQSTDPPLYDDSQTVATE